METNKAVEVEKKCDVCKKPVGDEYYDARMNCGCWADMCWECFRHFGLGLGLGKGQKYKRNADGSWKKIAG